MKAIMSLSKCILLTTIIALQYANSSAQTLYSLNFADASTYSVTCGTIALDSWTVRNNYCEFTTSPVVLPASPATQTICITMTIVGNSLDYSDTASISSCLNGTWTLHQVIHGLPGTHTETRSYCIVANASSTFQARVTFLTNASSDKWRMFNGGLTIEKEVNPLPVELLSFNGEKTYNAIRLDWKTITESNNSYFTLERSTDGTSYCTAGKVTGAGNSNTEKGYSFTDHEASEGFNYYRLKQTDWNGEENYCSEIVALEFERAALSFNAYVYPNPLKDSKIRLYIGSSEAEMHIIITDTQGKNLYMKTFPLSGRGQTFELSDLSGKLSSGLYLVTCISGKEYFQQKLLVR